MTTETGVRKLTPRKTWDTKARTYYGWDLRGTEMKCVVWRRVPFLTPEEQFNWPYRFETKEDAAPDFSISVQGDPADSLLTSWLREEERGEELSCVA